MTGSASAYLLVGDDEFPRTNAARALVRRLVPEAEQTFGLEIIEGKADTVDEAVRQVKVCRDALLTAGFLLAAGKLVWWRDVSFLTDGAVAKSEAVKDQLKQLAELVQSLPQDGNSLLLTAAGIDRRSSLFKAFKERHKIQEFHLPEKSYEVEKYARATAQAALREHGLRATSAVVQAFSQRAGTDARLIASEAEKLDLYLGDRRDVTEADVQAVVCAAASAGLWGFLDAVAEQETVKALEALHDLLANKESPVGIATMVASRLRELALYCEALDQGWVRLRSSDRGEEAVWSALPPAAETVFASGLKRDPRSAHPYVMMKLCKQAGKFSTLHIRQAQRVAAETQEKLVSSSLPERYLLEMMLLRISRTPGVDRR